MKVLWFSPTPSLYPINTKGYNGIGWIASLEEEIREQKSITLGVAFFNKKTQVKEKQIIKEVTYYPLKKDKRLITKLRKLFFHSKQNNYDIKELTWVVNDFKPDLIHVFGSENQLGLIGKHTNIPVIIHLQGILNPCLNAWFPPNLNIEYLFLKHIFSIKKICNKWWSYKNNCFMGNRELEILESCHYYMGRTEWDKNTITLLSKNATYFHCDEILRPIFYNINKQWKPKDNNTIKIQSVISNPFYKGLDLILKTAYILQKHTLVNFEWNVCGIQEGTFIEKRLGIEGKDVNVNYKGIVSSEDVANALIDCSVYVHPSYIDNSPNSICEAQILGVPVIATNTGGIPSLIKNKENGILIPCNDPFSLAHYIKYLSLHTEFAYQLGQKAKEVALIRHEKKAIVESVKNIYKKIRLQ